MVVMFLFSLPSRRHLDSAVRTVPLARARGYRTQK